MVLCWNFVRCEHLIPACYTNMSLNQPAVRAFPMLSLLNKSLFDMSVWKQSTCSHRVFEHMQEIPFQSPNEKNMMWFNGVNSHQLAVSYYWTAF